MIGPAEEAIPVLRDAGAHLCQFEILAQAFGGADEILFQIGLAIAIQLSPKRGDRAFGGVIADAAAALGGLHVAFGHVAMLAGIDELRLAHAACAQVILGQKSAQGGPSGGGDVIAGNAARVIGGDPVLQGEGLGHAAFDNAKPGLALAGLAAQDDGAVQIGRDGQDSAGLGKAAQHAARLGGKCGRILRQAGGSGMCGHVILIGWGAPRIGLNSDALQRLECCIDQRIIPPGFAVPDLAQHGRGRDAIPARDLPQGQARGRMIEVVTDRFRQPGRQRQAGEGGHLVVHLLPSSRPEDVNDP